jgi:glycosyltransferase involved in cell wall biosynthesis
VLAKVPAARFVIAGGGPLRESLETQARALGIAGRVSFLGHRNDIPDVVSAFDISVLPSVTEGLPLALLEALATGNPIVCTRVGGCPEIVDDGVNGFLVPPRDSAALADRILQLHADRALRDAIRARNLEKFSRRFTLRAMIDAHEQMFSELVGDVRSRARAA